MIKHTLGALAASLFFVASAQATPAIGDLAPDFTAKTASGKTVSLSQYRGKVVVLEWTNPGCPFVKKFYGSDTMQKLQADAKEKRVVWLSINSSAEGHEGYVDAGDAKEFIEDKKAVPTEYLLDASGAIGHLYGAKTTPHMFVITTSGTLAYAGAMDDKPSTDEDDIAGATNYVTAALDAVINGKKVKTPSTQPYGCPVKY
jgi:peroxiredoxin